MKRSRLGLVNIKAIALSVSDLARANDFYGKTLELEAASVGNEQLGWQLGDTILMLKDNWYAPPSEELNPRITIATENAIETQKELTSRGVRISDPVERYDHSYVGSFLDSEGNKLWFCSLI